MTDTLVPVITLLGDNSVDVEFALGSYVEPGYKVADAGDPAVAETVSYNKETQVLVNPFLDGANPSAGGAASPFGDHFVVYPGPDGPIDSIRWKFSRTRCRITPCCKRSGSNPKTRC